jgi:SPP1 family predicted phage head-tail adaptor
VLRAPFSLRGGRVVKVDIEQLQAGQDGYGSPSTAWTPFAQGVPARLEDGASTENYGAQQIQALSRFDVLMRYRDGVTNKMRLSFTNDGLPYLLDIEDVDNPGLRNRWLILKCKSGVNRG